MRLAKILRKGAEPKENTDGDQISQDWTKANKKCDTF